MLAQRQDGSVPSVFAAPSNYHNGWHMFILPSISLPADEWSTALLDSLKTVLVPKPDSFVLGSVPENGGHTHTNAQTQSHTHTATCLS